ncbi:tetratricopeptide repeat protein [Millisia brevis]|uniref:tetratricopeptide repeat protein n=1 Tax=Millisia brevis TaxID=264148 RepID=UPI000A027F99|nr:tetratricopeptide repeat protein [Millisia brevis]
MSSQARLADAYLTARRLPESITLYEPVLTHSEGIRGPDHLATLTYRNNLAVAYRFAEQLP